MWSRDKVDREWIIPHIDRILHNAGEDPNDEKVFDVYSKIVSGISLRIRTSEGKEREATYEYGMIGQDYFICYWIFKLYEKPASDRSPVGELFDAIEKACRQILSVNKPQARLSPGDIKEMLHTTGNARRDAEDKSVWSILVDVTPQTVSRLGLKTSFDGFLKALQAVKAVIEKRIGGRDTMVEMLLKESLLRRRRKSR